MHFQHLGLYNWRQFERAEIDLSRQVTVLTGQNGTGKTTLLTILARHFGWNINFVSTPFWGQKKRRQFWSDVRRIREAQQDSPSDQAVVGKIIYDNGTVCDLRTTTEVQPQYQLTYNNQQHVVGLHIPSHRPVATYQKLDSIPTDPKTIEQHYQDFQQLLFQTYGSSRAGNPGIAQKRSLISLALFGYGNDAVHPNPEYREMFEGFQDVLSKILPSNIGFQRLQIRMPEVVLVTESGDFALDAMSGGINALFGMAWQIHMYGADKDACTVTIDEPENHLHPSMQRSILPSLARAFPRFRFIIATHSPFIVSSIAESSVYGLTFGSTGGVVAEKLDAKDLSGTPNRVLREILDVPSNLPLWVEQRVKELLRSNANKSPTERAADLFALLRELGIADAIPEIPFDGTENA